jgi:hypothetical protein
MSAQKAYIAGKITGDDGYRDKFAAAEMWLIGLGYIVLSPARLPEGFEHHEYMVICLAMVSVCEIVFFLPGWTTSKGAKDEHAEAKRLGKTIVYLTGGEYGE